MNESHNNKRNNLISHSLIKLVFGKKPEVKKQPPFKVINSPVANNFFNLPNKQNAEKTKTEPKNANNISDDKYWFNSDWKGGIRIIGKTAYNYRSSWEVNYALYLQMLLEKGVIAKWEYEPELFTFPNIKRGIKAYLPDFKITYPDERIEFHEVKGYADPKTKTKLKRFLKYYPNIKLKIIDKNWFDACKKVFNFVENG